MDEFSWFVGLYEGEGSIHYEKNYKVVKLKINMTDEDTIARAAKFLDCKYRKVHSPSHQKWKPQYMVRPSGQRIVGLFETMLPYLSKRRQEQVREKLGLFYENQSKRKDGKNRKPVSKRKTDWT